MVQKAARRTAAPAYVVAFAPSSSSSYYSSTTTTPARTRMITDHAGEYNLPKGKGEDCK